MRALVYGAVNTDVLHVVDRIPQRGDDIRSRQWSMAWGGKAANAAMALARWQCDVRLLGLPIGRDALGDALLSSLDVAHLDRTWLVRTDEPSRHCIILRTPDGDRTIICTGYEGARWQAIPDGAWKGVDAVLVDGFAGRHATRVVAEGVERGIPVVWLDAPDPPPAPATLVVWSRHEHSIDAAAALARKGVPVVLTASAEPIHAWWDGRRIEIAPPQIEVVDATGSGDVFAAGCAFGLASGWDRPQLLEFAAAAGAAAAARRRTKLPTLEDIAALGQS